MPHKLTHLLANQTEKAPENASSIVWSLNHCVTGYVILFTLMSYDANKEVLSQWQAIKRRALSQPKRSCYSNLHLSGSPERNRSEVRLPCLAHDAGYNASLLVLDLPGLVCVLFDAFLSLAYARFRRRQIYRRAPSQHERQVPKMLSGQGMRGWNGSDMTYCAVF